MICCFIIFQCGLESELKCELKCGPKCGLRLIPKMRLRKPGYVLRWILVVITIRIYGLKKN